MSYGLLTDIFIDDQLMFSKRLAKKIGLNEAIFVQQLHYWIKKCGHERDGYKWIYNSSQQWQEEFFFWSPRTVERIIKSLRDKHIVEVGNYNQARFDRTNWYRINYEVLDGILREIMEESSNNEGSDSGELDSAKMTEPHSAKMTEPHSAKMTEPHSAKMTEPIPENTREYITENTAESISCSERSGEHSKQAESAEPLADVEAITLNTGEEWKPTQKQYEKWCRLYPNVDVKREIGRMSLWSDEHKTRRKTRNGIGRFVNSWLDKEQNEYKNHVNSKPVAKTSKTEQTMNDMDRVFKEMAT